MAFPINKVDLCANQVRVTKEGLQELANIASFRSRVECETLLRSIQEKLSSSLNYNTVYLEAERLANAAKNLETSLRFKVAFDSLAEGERNELVILPQI
jgi:50S ribosomal subunit-associated GTPase HflX